MRDLTPITGYTQHHCRLHKQFIQDSICYVTSETHRHYSFDEFIALKSINGYEVFLILIGAFTCFVIVLGLIGLFLSVSTD